MKKELPQTKVPLPVRSFWLKEAVGVMGAPQDANSVER